MPKIPILTAEHQGPRGIDLPGIPAPPKIITGFEQLGQLGETIGTIGDRLQKQEDDLKLLKASSAYDFQYGEATLKLSENPRYYEHETIATKNVRDISDSVRKQFNLSGAVDAAFVAHVQGRMAKDILGVKIEARQMQGQQISADLMDLKQMYSTLAAEAVTPEGRDDAIRNFTEAVKRAEQRGFLHADQSKKILLDFTQDRLAKNMDYLRRVSPWRMWALEDEGAFANVDPIRHDQILRAAEADKIRVEHAKDRELAKLRSEENITLYRKLRDDSLTPEDMLASPHLDRQDMEFFWGALKKQEVTPETNPATAIMIEDLLDKSVKNRGEAIDNATAAKALIKNAYVDEGSLLKTDALSMYKRANDKIAGANPETDRWFHLSKEFLKDKFGWQGGVVGRFLKPEGAQKYWELVSQLMAEQEANPTQMDGKAIYDRAVQLAGPAAVNFWSGEAGQPGPKATEQLPDAAKHKGRTVQDTKTGKTYRSDGKKWLPLGGVPAPPPQEGAIIAP